MPTLDIEKFDPTAAQLQELVALPVELTDPRNADQVKSAHEKRMKLREARVAITKKGKELREDALAFQKAVISKEKDLVAIVEPEEERLQSFEDQAADLKERDARLALLPRRREQLAELGGDPLTDEEVLAMDGTTFQSLLNKRLGEKNAKEAEENRRKAEELAAKEAQLKAAEEEAARKAREEAAAKEREEKARQEERDRLAREEEARKAREAAAAKEAEENATAEKLRLERAEKYRAWRTSLGWTEATKDEFNEETVTIGGKRNVVLYKKLGVFVVDDAA